jgi:hypothetical protein
LSSGRRRRRHRQVINDRFYPSNRAAIGGGKCAGGIVRRNSVQGRNRIGDSYLNILSREGLLGLELVLDVVRNLLVARL